MTSNLSSVFLAGVMGLTATVTIAPSSDAQAYCALRDPVSQIYEVCPQANSYRSVVRTIDEAARDRILNTVPYPMHFSELGRHTLYIGLDGARPVGLVQSRSERSRWGLVEVVWSFDLDLKITGFALQRCRARSSDRAVVDSEAFRSLIAGRSLDGLVELLSEDGKALAPEAAALISGNHDLAVTVLRCGIKTLAATDAAWSDDVATARLWQEALAAFPEAAALTVVAQPAGGPELEGSAIVPEQVKVFAVQDRGSETLGLLVFTQCRFGRDALGVWWAIDANQTLQRARAVDTADPLVAESLAALRGRGLEDMGDPLACADPLKLVAMDVLAGATDHLAGEGLR